MELTFWAVGGSILFSKQVSYTLPDNEFTQLMRGLQGERLRQAFKHLDEDQDGFILPDQFKRIILVSRSFPTNPTPLLTTLKEIAGHKLSDSVIERLPTLCTLTPGQRISYSEVNAFYNVIRGTTIPSHLCLPALTCI